MTTPTLSFSDQPLTADQTRKMKLHEDLVYTLNHAAVCFTFDMVGQSALGNLIQNNLHQIGHWSHRNIPVFGGAIEKTIEFISSHGHGHDHGHDHDHGHHHGKQSAFWHWFVGEGVGDVGAVPVTLAMQYYTPGVMRGIQYLTEPVMGPLFRMSARGHAKRWANDNGLAPDAEEAKALEEKIYQHEVTHLPHAAMWTAWSVGLNVATQKVIGNKGTIGEIGVAKASGALMTLATVMGIRTISPVTAQRIDNFNSEKIAKPVLNRVSKWFGIDQQTVDRVLAEEQQRAGKAPRAQIIQPVIHEAALTTDVSTRTAS